ncbi:B3 domain-containing protein Os02g0598200-like isoform X2 [Cornus florida]|uniref:B3 domain-containing protein Os02g0598200-like isoform X2 n=1 Tax=Cornus florida TaxID=4283 RepID=UPI00289E719A|nr:B3 domain-containing protein Os02g0598200-like isoform X2 [Cornus florida]
MSTKGLQKFSVLNRQKVCSRAGFSRQEDKMGCNVEACAECTQNCQLIHGKKKDSSATITSFFKVMIGDDFSKVLFLPPKFARTVSALVGEKTYLEDSMGLRWSVKVSNSGGSIAFEQGWHAFSLGHNLESGDFLVFNYIKGSHFVVQIYGKSGCHKLAEKSRGRKKIMRTNSDSIAKDGPCYTVDKGSMNREVSSTSVVSQPDIEITESQCHMIGVEKVPMVMENTLTFDRDPRMKQRVGRSSLYELSNFGRPMSSSGADDTKKVLVEDERSHHADTVLRPQAETLLVDNGPAAKAVLVDSGLAAEAVSVDNGLAAVAVGSWAAPSETSHFATNAKNDDSMRMDKIIFMSRKDSGSGNSSGHLLGTSAAEAARNGKSHAEMSNSVIKKCQKAKRKRDAQSSTDGVSQKECTSLMESSPNVLQKITGYSEFHNLPVSIAMQNCQFGKRMQVVKKEREMGTHEETRHGKEPKMSNERGQSDNYKGYKVVKNEPVDSTDVSSLDAISSVVGDSQSFLELPTNLPSISFKGRTRMDRKLVLLRDPVSRLWPVLYHEKYGVKVLASGWKGFRKANNVQPGDQCGFAVEDVLECIYRVNIVGK